MVVRDFRENCGGEAHLLPSRDDKPRFLNKLNGLPSGVVRNSLVKPLIRDCRTVGVLRRHQRAFEEGGCPPVEHLNVHGIDLLELLSQSGMVVRVQHL